jgi:hypothetical protein
MSYYSVEALPVVTSGVATTSTLMHSMSLLEMVGVSRRVRFE